MVSLHGPFIRNKNALKEYWNTTLSLLCYYREINPVFTIGQHSTGANLEIPFTVHFSRPWLRFVIHCTRLRESWKWKAPGLIPAGCFSIQLLRLRWPVMTERLRRHPVSNDISKNMYCHFFFRFRFDNTLCWIICYARSKVEPGCRCIWPLICLCRIIKVCFVFFLDCIVLYCHFLASTKAH